MMRYPTRAAWTLTPIVVASGFAGLGYEIVWTRMLSLTLGTEMMAVLGVIAGFFGGLALGAFLLDGLIRRAASPRRAYALLEAVIGVWGLASIVLLPAAGRALAPLLGTDPSPVLLWAMGFALPMLGLLPATMAMGGTLTALDRMAGIALRDARVAAAIYGGNTAGAVAGTLAAAYVLTPAFGLSGTLAALSVLNFACAMAALALGPASCPAPAARAAPAQSGGTRLGLALFATGLLGVAFEVVIVRLAAQFLQDTIYSFANLLAAYLLGTAAGGLAWQAAGRRLRARPATWLLAGTAFVCLCTAALVPAIAALAAPPAKIGEQAVALALFFLPSAAMGALFSHLAQAVRDRRGSLGIAVGINSLGAALAPLVAAGLLIPGFGAWTALLSISFGYLLLVKPGRAAMAWCAPPAVLLLALALGPAPSLIRIPPGGALIALREGPMATASVVEDAGGVRYLEVNGHFRMGGTSSKRSDYRQAMVPLLLHPAPRSAVFLGLGTGATLVGGAHFPGAHVQGVELSPEVAALLPRFADPADGPPPPVTIADARRYVTATRDHYDVVIADLYHPALDGSGALYTTEHFAAIRKILSPGGIFCQWLPLYQLDERSLKSILRSFLAIYPEGSAWLNHYSVATPMLALIGGRSAVRIDPATLAARLAEPAMAQALQPFGLATPVDLLGQFVGGATALADYAGPGLRNTDDYPAVTLDARNNVQALSVPPSALLLTLIHAVHPSAGEVLAPQALDAWSTRLAAYWQARNRFLEAGAALQGAPRGAALIAAAVPGLIESIRLSAEFDPAYQPLLGMAHMLGENDPAASRALLMRVDAAAPGRSEAREMMARMK
jgi:spermidine synthase